MLGDLEAFPPTGPDHAKWGRATVGCHIRVILKHPPPYPWDQQKSETSELRGGAATPPQLLTARPVSWGGVQVHLRGGQVIRRFYVENHP